MEGKEGREKALFALCIKIIINGLSACGGLLPIHYLCLLYIYVCMFYITMPYEILVINFKLDER